MKDQTVLRINAVAVVVMVLSFIGIGGIMTGLLHPMPFGLSAMTLLASLGVMCLCESTVKNVSWKKRRKRWLAGGCDPAYPDSDSERKRCRGQHD